MRKNIFSTSLFFLVEEVCYDGYGCFSNAPPYDVSFALLPRDPVTLNTTYLWNTREENIYQFNAPFEYHLKRFEKIEKKKKTFIVAHGFIGELLIDLSLLID